jgi:hypothetical protein
MTKNRKIFIHIGQHKTGSTSIQQTLCNNGHILKKYGLSYYRTNPNGKLNAHVSAWIKVGDRKSLQYCDDDAIIIQPEKLAQNASKLIGDIVISSEEFSWVSNKDQLLKFKLDLEKYFDHIIIITYIRRQDLQIVSHHQEEIKSNNPRLFPNGNIAIPKHEKHVDYYLDYNDRLSKWGDIFGDKNLRIRVFETENLYKKDVVLDFFKLIGIEKGVLPLKSNESWGFERSKVVYLMEKNKLNKYIKKIIYQNLNNKGKLLPSKAEAEKTYLYYKNSNIKLNSRFLINAKNPSIFNENFFLYPKERKDVWTEESANKAIYNIIDAINSISPGKFLYIALKTKLFSVKRKIKKYRRAMSIT